MAQQTNVLCIGDGEDWHFVNGDWTDGEDGLLAIPEELIRSEGYSMQGLHWAFHRKLCYRDCVVRFELSLESHTDAGIILRARDESHFYLLHFPNCGQASRAQHFWVALSKMDDSGYLRGVEIEMVRRVPSTNGVWLSVQIAMIGRRFAVRVGDYGRFEAEDDTYSGPGLIGLYMGAVGEPPKIRNVSVEGEPAPRSVWRDGVGQPVNWFHPVPTPEDGWQQSQNLVRFPDGELLLRYNMQVSWEGGWADAPRIPYLTRSQDGGRTWSEPESYAPVGSEDDSVDAQMHLTPGGRLIALVKDEEEWFACESPDRGRSWSAPAAMDSPTCVPGLARNMAPGHLLNLSDGSMITFCAGTPGLFGDIAKELNLRTWGSWHAQTFCSRSEDDGFTWSNPVNVDTPGADADGNPYEGNLDVCEPCAVQLSSGRILSLHRPIYSPWMWESWSDDGGRTWGPCVRGPFPGYGGSNILRTASGALLVPHRLPWLTVHCSLDEGVTWDQGTMIDNGAWCIARLCEIEPDLVLIVYWDAYESLMRAQFIRVTPGGLEAARDMQPSAQYSAAAK